MKKQQEINQFINKRSNQLSQDVALKFQNFNGQDHLHNQMQSHVKHVIAPFCKRNERVSQLFSCENLGVNMPLFTQHFDTTCVNEHWKT